MAQFPKSLQRAGWLQTEAMKTLFAALGEEARVVGGAVRDALLGSSITGEIDIATAPHSPKRSMRRLKKKGIRVIPHRHGAWHAHSGLRRRARFEITTLRVDVKSDGRHAEVAFTQRLEGGCEKARLHDERALRFGGRHDP